MPDSAGFATTRLPATVDVVATDGSDVRVLLATRGGSMAHFTLAPGATSIAVAHRTIDEVWFFVSGRGEMWRSSGQQEEIVTVEPGTCITIPVGTRFQYRTTGAEPLTAVGVATPPWPGEGEAYAVQGPWPPSPAARP